MIVVELEKMPETCEDCPFGCYDDYVGGITCFHVGNMTFKEAEEKRHDDCPIKEI